MTQDPRVRSEWSDGVPSPNRTPADDATAFFSSPQKVSQVAQTLAEYVGGAVSVELAFDLVLNDVVEQARMATGASGAAVALFRDGELTCRATAGENAPDLGVKVDSVSGLAGSCVSSREMQQCQDTETDPRVNAEACRRLGVRSMLIAPLLDGQRIIGIIEVFSAWPNAFGNREISALQVLAARIAENNREAESSPTPAPDVPAPVLTEAPPLTTEATASEHFEGLPELQADDGAPPAPDVWSAVLVVLVILAAVALGVMIGWRRAARAPSAATNAPAETNASARELQGTPPADATEPVPSPKSTSPAASSVPPRAPAAPVIPPGGLVVTQDGKVVYRSPAPTRQGASTHSPQRRLIHRVNPEYPEEAKAQHIAGAVVLDLQVLASGAVGDVNVVSGDPLLAQSAVDAVKQWRYQPENVNGRDVESQARITVKFSLPSP